MTDYDQVKDALLFIDAHDRDTWVMIGGAIKNEFGDSGFELWDTWSQSADNYEAKSAKSVWRSLKSVAAGSTATIGSIFHLAKEKGFQLKVPTDPAAIAKAEQDRKDRQRVRARQAAAEEKLARKMQASVRDVAQVIVDQHTKTIGKSSYLGTKRVGAYRVLFPRQGLIVVTDEDAGTVRLISGPDEISQFFQNRDDESFLYLKPETLLVPCTDEKGVLWNLQAIFSEKKRFMKAGRKAGLFHVIGDPEQSPRTPLCVVEGYATGASVYEATSWPVYVAFDTGNLMAVAKTVRAKYPDDRIVICGDDDVNTPGNPGRTKAEAAAAAVDGNAIFPRFPE